MFIGEDGLRRVIDRTLELMREHDTDDIAPHGGIPLAMIQRYFNFWAPRIYDLFGNDESPRAAQAFDAGIKGRIHEAGYADHRRLDDPVSVERRDADGFAQVDVPMRHALNGLMRQEYLKEVQLLMSRWNRTLRRAGVERELTLPSPRFNRNFGVYEGLHCSPSGDPVDAESFEAHRAEWLPTAADRAHLAALLQPAHAIGKMAGWIAPPLRGINSQPVDFEYVRF